MTLAGVLALCLAVMLAERPAAFAAPLPAATPAQHCRAETFEGAGYTVCSFDLSATDVRVFSAAPNGAPYRTFEALRGAVAGGGLVLDFAINGGMFQADWRPVGLLIEGGVERHPVNRASAPAAVTPVPNFYKQPNGVFFVARGRAGIFTTDAFVRQSPKVDYATQSGPMLVIDGKLHPAFIPGSADRTYRSGVGVVGDTGVVFAVSADTVNFDEFARLFRDRLGCRNALFLDGGSAAGLYAPEMGRTIRPVMAAMASSSRSFTRPVNLRDAVACLLRRTHDLR